jgi:hypothetical protein
MFSSLLIFALLCVCYHVAEANPEAKIVEDLTEAMNTISERSAAGLRTLQDNALASLQRHVERTKTVTSTIHKDIEDAAASYQTSPQNINNILQTGGPNSNSMLASLRSHGATAAIIQEINNMHGSNIPRESILAHVATHFPDKKQSDLNDIVISALGVGGNLHDEVKATVKKTKAKIKSPALKIL